MESWICSRDPEIMSGELCFTGTRVPVGFLFGYLSEGYALERFLEAFPTVEREQAVALLEAYEHPRLPTPRPLQTTPAQSAAATTGGPYYPTPRRPACDRPATTIPN